MKPFIWRLDGVFTWVLASSLQASVLVCLILAVQAIARRKLPPRWYYALWFLLIARMLLPWVPESRLSVFNLMPVSPPVTGLPLSGTSDDVFINQAIDWPAEPLLPVFVAPESAPLTETPSALGLPRAPVRRLALPFLPMAWLVGVLAFTGYVLAENVLFWLRLRREPMAAEPELLGLLAACKGEMGVHIPVGVVPTDRVNSPAVFGFVRPRLLLPRKALETLTQDELRYVFLHELAHLKRRDILVNWVLTALQGLHWFNPLIWYAFHRMRMDRELACDALALSYTRPGESKAYGNTIVGLVEQLYKVRRVPGLAGILEDKSQLKRRITMIALFKKHSWRLSLVALVVVAALGAVALTNAKADTTSTGGQPLSAPVSMPQDSGGAYAGDSDDNDVAMINNVAEKPLQRPQDVKLVQDEVAENGEGAAADSEPIRRVTAPVVQTGGHPAHDKAEKPTAMEAEAGKALDTLVSLDFTDTHISEIVKGLADAVQYNIVIDSRVVAPKEGAAPVSVPEGYRPAAFITDGVVPYINAANVPLHEVLEDLTEMLNLDYTVQPGFIWISTPLRIRMEAGFEELETRYYYLKARGREAADTVELLRKTVPDVFEFMGATERRLSSMEFNPEHNRLVVRNTPSNLSLLEQLLKRLDIAAGDQTEDKRLQGAAEVPPFGVRRVDWSHNRLRIPLGSIDVGGSIPFIEITLQKTMQLPDGSARARLQVEKQSKAGHAQRHSMWYSEGERILGHDASDPFVCKVVRVDAEDGTCDVYSGKTDSIFTLRLSNSDGGKEPVAPAAQARDLSDGRGVPRLGEHGNVAAPGAEPQAGPQKPADEAARRRVEGILEGPVSLDFEGEHISTILDFIRRYLDVKIELDNTVVAPRPGTEPPTDAEQADQYVTDGIVEDIAVRNVPLYEGLHALLQPLFLDFGIRGDAIWISTPEKIREQLGGRFAPAPVPKESPLHEAARDGHQDAVRRLLRRGADINAKDDAGRTPLHWAAANGHVGMVKFLVSRGADVNTKDNDGRCPIHLAAQNGHEATLTMLAVRGADVMPKDKAGKTPLDLAREGGHKQTAAAIELYAPDASGGGSRQNDAAGQAGDSPEAAESDEAQEPGEQIVTADLRNMRLADVLQVLRERAGNIEIIAHVDDTVPVTLSVRNVPLREALEQVADAAGLTLLEQPGRLRLVQVNSEGRIVDKTDYPFVDDPDVIGTWTSVDFVDEPADFTAGEKRWPADLYLKQLVILPGGRTEGPWTWTKGLLLHPGSRHASRYIIKELDGEKYMFFEWKSGDYSIRHMKPSYYVLKKNARGSDTAIETQSAPGATDVTPISTGGMNARIQQLDIDTATLEDVLRVLGEPIEYVWGKQKFTKGNLPSTYCVVYPRRFLVVMNGGQIEELRHHEPGYVFRGKLQVGSSLEEALEVIGEPTETVEGRNEWKDGVLYKNIGGGKGNCYYQRNDQDVRLFFSEYKVSALYVTRSDYGEREQGGGSFKTVRPIAEVNEFDDVRWKDMTKLDLSTKSTLPSTLTFNQKTVWPDRLRMPADVNPEELLLDAMNPGLGVRELHRQGITGQGVTVAIIDQPMYLDHPEFAGKVVEYHDVGCGSESSMHGPAVASLLVGEQCGTAPGARLYHVAAPSWTKDAAYQAKALNWLIDKNETLPDSDKIRVVSVSAAPSGPGSPFNKDNAMWDEACARAEAAGMMVLDCTSHRGIIGPSWLDAGDPENVAKCTPGFPGRGSSFRPGRLLVPTCPRTTAEEYDKGDCSYQYCGRGGLSWAIPYAAGVLAMGWQLRPELGAEQMRDLLFESAHKKSDGAQMINPKAFIELVKEAKARP